MAGVMDQVRPNVAVGQQPNQIDAVEPSSPSVIPEGAVTAPVTQATPPQQATPPASEIPNDLDSLISQANQEHGDLEAMIAKANEEAKPVTDTDITAKAAEATGVGDFLKSLISTQVQAFKAGARTGIARNETERLTGLEQVYGKDNVKVSGDTVMVRPAGQKTFRKFDDATVGLISAFLNGNQALPPVAQIAGSAATNLPGMASQVAGTVAGGVAGASVPIPGAGVVGAGAGTYLGLKTSQYLSDQINSALDQKDPDYVYQNKYDTFLDSIQSDPAQVAMGMASYGLSNVMAKRALNEIEASSRGLSKESNKAVNEILQEVTPSQKSWLEFNTGLEKLKSLFIPSKGGEEVASGSTMNAIMAERQKVGAKAELVKDVAQQIAEGGPEKKLSKIDSFLGWAKEELGLHGYKTNDQKLFDASGNLIVDVKGSDLKVLANFYENLRKDVSGGGVDPKRLQTAMNDIAERANFGAPNRTEIEKTLGRAWMRLGEDRDMYYSALFKDSASPEAQMWKQTLSDYNQKQMAVKRVQRFIGNNVKGLPDAEQSANIENLSQQILDNAGKKGKAIENLTFILGEDSPHLTELRADVFDKFIQRSSGDGSVNYGYVKKMISDPKYDSFWNFVFKGNEEQKQSFKAFTLLSEGYSKNPNENAAKKIASVVFDIAKGMNIPGAKLLPSLVDNNVQVIDHMSDLVKTAYKTANNAQQKRTILRLSNEIDQFRAGAQVVNGVTKNGQKIKKYVQVGRNAVVQQGSRLPTPQPNQIPVQNIATTQEQQPTIQ